MYSPLHNTRGSRKYISNYQWIIGRVIKTRQFNSSTQITSSLYYSSSTQLPITLKLAPCFLVQSNYNMNLELWKFLTFTTGGPLCLLLWHPHISNSLLQNVMSSDNFDYDDPMHRSELREGTEKMGWKHEWRWWSGLRRRGGKRIELGYFRPSHIALRSHQSGFRCISHFLRQALMNG